MTRALNSVGMSGYEHRSPHHLSAGEKKRVALATVLALDTELLVMDEPTVNLDPGGKWSLINLLDKLPITKIIASHDLELVKALCQRVVILDRGEIVAQGDTASTLGDISLLCAHGLAAPDRVAA